jgi:hypothetical protein
MIEMRYSKGERRKPSVRQNTDRLADIKKQLNMLKRGEIKL